MKKTGPDEGGIGGKSPLSREEKAKIALKMHGNVSNFKKFLPAAPISTAGGINLFQS